MYFLLKESDQQMSVLQHPTDSRLEGAKRIRHRKVNQALQLVCKGRLSALQLSKIQRKGLHLRVNSLLDLIKAVFLKEHHLERKLLQLLTSQTKRVRTTLTKMISVKVLCLLKTRLWLEIIVVSTWILRKQRPDLPKMELTTISKKLSPKECLYMARQAEQLGPNSFRKVCQRQCVQVDRRRITLSREVKAMNLLIKTSKISSATMSSEQVKKSKMNLRGDLITEHSSVKI